MNDLPPAPLPWYGPLELLLAYNPSLLPVPGTVGDPENPQEREHRANRTDSLEGLLMEKVRCLSDILSQIAYDIEQRTLLSHHIIGHIYRHYCYVKTGLLELYQWQLGTSRSVEQRRTGIEQQLGTLIQEKRQEQVRCWQDIAQLKKEFRQWLKQYCDVVQRVRIILPNRQKKPMPTAKQREAFPDETY